MENLATNSSTPSDPPRMWVPEPTQRGTFGIISLCFSTLIIGTWNNPHLGIPTGQFSATRRLLLQATRMLLAICAPELLLVLATNELTSASRLMKIVLEFHPHLVAPGKFARMYRYIRRVKIRGYCFERGTSQPHYDLDYAFYAVMGGFAFDRPYDDDHSNIEESPFERVRNAPNNWDIPRSGTLIYIMKHFPHIILDVHKHVTIVPAVSSGQKALLIIQLGWFCTSCASRLFRHLSLSLLEVSTAAHAFCTLVTYLVWWSKPLNVAAPTLLMGEEAQEVYALLKCSDSEYDMAMAILRKEGDSGASQGPQASAKIVLATRALRHLCILERPPPEPRFTGHHSLVVPGSFSNESPNKELVRIVAAISPILYGPIHFLAWNGHFPTPPERLLWRVSSIVVTCSGLVGFCVPFFFMRLSRLSKFRVRLDVVANIMSVAVIPAIHIPASAFLIVESLRQLAFLDSTAYEVPSWTNYWPHIS